MFIRVLPCLWIASALALAGCGPGEGASGSTGGGGGGGAGGSGSGGAPSPYNVEESEQAGADWDCSSPSSCIADYLAFPGKAPAEEHHPITEAQLLEQLDAIKAMTVTPQKDPISDGAMRDAIRGGLGIGFLQDGMDGRLLQVITTATKDAADHTERDLIFVDPYVGTFKAVLLVPHGAGPFPAVVAIHGHGDDAEIYRDSYHGAEWPSHGYAILMLTMRAMAIDADENQAWHALIREGFGLMGMRVYESLLGLKYLRYRPEIKHDRIGLIGHSGGSSASNLTARIEPGFRALVTDNVVDWYVSGDNEPYHCETAPLLYPYGSLINDFSTEPVPVKVVLYGYVNGMQEIFDFFDSHLKG